MKITILPDIPPVAFFSAPSSVLRDPLNSNTVNIPCTDLSYSTDDDNIMARNWKYKFDSQNDGNFANDIWLLFDASQQSKTEPVLSLPASSVGKYLIHEDITEDYGLTASYELNVEVINTAPVAVFDTLAKKKIDLVILTDYSGTKLSGLTTKLNSYKASLNAANFDVSYSVASSQMSVGTQNLTQTLAEYACGAKVNYYKTGNSQWSSSSGGNSYDSYTNRFESQTADLYYSYEPLPPPPNIQMYTQYHNVTSNGMFGGSRHTGTYYYFYDASNPNQKASVDLDTYSDYSYSTPYGSSCGITSQTFSNISWYPTGWYATGNYNTVQQSYTVKAVDVNTLPVPRQGADTYIMLLCDSGDTTFATWGQYFPFGSLTNETLKYAVSNNAKVYAVMPETGYDILLRNNYSTNCSTQGLTVRQLVNTSTGGMRYTSGQLDQALDSIKGQSASPQVINNSYIIVSEDTFEYDSSYSDYESDPKKEERWKYTHSPSVFENSSSLADFSGKYLNSPVTSLGYPGRYDIEYQVRDDPTGDSRFETYSLWSNPAKLTIYAHRRPVAQFSVSITHNAQNQYIPTTSETSFDLDHLSQLNRGIAAKRWQWKESCVCVWTDGTIPSTLPTSKEYDVKLEVQDMEGAWSKPSIQTIKTYGINLPPTVDANPTSKDSSDNITATVTASDQGEGDFSYTRYVWSQSVEKPGLGWMNSYSKTFNTTLSSEGTWYLHIEAFDTAGNSFYRCRGPYTITKLKITGVTLEGYWNHWRGQVDMFGKQLTNEPHRFLSLECVKINVNTSGYADRVEVNFSPELEAMQYVDCYGNVYDYSDYFGYEVDFPKVFTLDGSKKDNQMYWEYYLPLAPSTKDFEDVRLRGAYSMLVKVYRGSGYVTYAVNDIEITGNVYDLAYVQPVK